MTEQIDPLVARLEAQLDKWEQDEPREDWWGWQRDVETLLAGYRSQAERIAALEADAKNMRKEFRATTTKTMRLEKLLCAAEDFSAKSQGERRAAEARLADALAALEQASDQMLHDYRTWVADDADAKPRYGQIPRYDLVNATLSRLTAEQNGGGK